MAIYHLSMKTVGRSAGRSAPAAAAYRHAQCLTDERTGLVHDYTRKQGVETSLLLLPEDAPDWAADRAQLWNAAERAETRRNSTVAREIVVALPAELSARERLELVQELGQGLVERHGVAVDVAIHAPHRQGDQRNHHAHLLLTTRRLEADGLTAKTRELDNQRSGEVEHWRGTWAALANRHLERAGHRERIDHRSLAAQGIEREPTQHQGPYATQLARQVQPAPEMIGLDRYDDNAMVRFENDRRERVRQELTALREPPVLEEFYVQTRLPGEREWGEFQSEPLLEEYTVETLTQRQDETPSPSPSFSWSPEVLHRADERVRSTLWGLAERQPEVAQARAEVQGHHRTWLLATARLTGAGIEIEAWRNHNPARARLHDLGLRSRELVRFEQEKAAALQREREAAQIHREAESRADERLGAAYWQLEAQHGQRMRQEECRAEVERQAQQDAARQTQEAQKARERESQRQEKQSRPRQRQR